MKTSHLEHLLVRAINHVPVVCRPKTGAGRRLFDLSEEASHSLRQAHDELRAAVRRAGFNSPKLPLRRLTQIRARAGSWGSSATAAAASRRRSIQEQVILENGEYEVSSADPEPGALAERRRQQAVIRSSVDLRRVNEEGEEEEAAVRSEPVAVGPRRLEFVPVEAVSSDSAPASLSPVIEAPAEHESEEEELLLVGGGKNMLLKRLSLDAGERVPTPRPKMATGGHIQADDSLMRKISSISESGGDPSKAAPPPMVKAMSEEELLAGGQREEGEKQRSQSVTSTADSVVVVMVHE